MKAALLEQVGPIDTAPLSIVDVAPPTAGAGELLLRVEACGVCRSNLHMIEGDWLPGAPAKLPIVPGHEVVGVIAELGTGVTGWQVGDRVVVQPIWSSCGSCRFCLTGRKQLCRGRQITGETRDGGYAEFMLAEAGYVYRIPDGLDPAAAAPLMCPGITAYGSVGKAGLGPGQRAGVIGVGGVGHMVLQLARLTGADVVAISRSDLHAATAEQAGASATYRPGPERGLADGALDATIVFAPARDAVAEAVRVTRPGGTIVLGVSEAIGVVDVGDEKRIAGSVLGSRWEMLQVLELAAAGQLRAMHDDFPLAEANAVLQRLKAGDIRARAVLIPTS